MSDTTWPLTGYHFAVQFGGGITGTFQIVAGLEQTHTPIEYHSGNGSYAPIKMPPIGKVGAVTMHKGIFADTAAFWTWSNGIAMNTLPRGTIVIALVDPNGATAYSWSLSGASLTRVARTDLQSDATEVAVDLIDVECVTITQSAG